MVFSTTILFSSSNYELKKDLHVKKGEIYPKSIVSLKGDLNIEGAVKESIILVGGQITLSGNVEEDVICFASDVKIGKDAKIKRDLFVIGGTLERDSNSVVEGEFFYFKFNLKKIENTLIPILADSKTLSFLKTIKIILWFIIALVVFVIIPHKINKAKELFDTHRLKIGLVGLLGLFAFIFLLFISILLCFVIIGIPMIIVLIIFYLVIYVFGRTVIFYFIGDKISNYLKVKKIAPVFFILIGVIVYALLKFIPYVGPIIVILLNIFEMGIGVGYFFRKKLNLS
jgi:hypothetical protein